MTHIPGKQDKDIHNPDGTHISTPPSSSGWVLERWERYLREHLAAHVAFIPAMVPTANAEETCPNCSMPMTALSHEWGPCGI